MSQSIGAVADLPLDRLWDESGPLDARKIRTLTARGIKTLLRARPMRFVVAQSGAPLDWVAARDCYTFWTAEVRPHLHEESKHYLDDYPDGYLYFASEWLLPDGERVIVLEMQR